MNSQLTDPRWWKGRIVKRDQSIHAYYSITQGLVEVVMHGCGLDVGTVVGGKC